MYAIGVALSAAGGNAGGATKQGATNAANASLGAATGQPSTLANASAATFTAAVDDVRCVLRKSKVVRVTNESHVANTG